MTVRNRLARYGSYAVAYGISGDNPSCSTTRELVTLEQTAAVNSAFI
jgi:hypothetical protein